MTELETTPAVARDETPRARPRDTSRERLRVAAIVLLAGIAPWLATFVLHLRFGGLALYNEPAHESIELIGACIALGVAGLVLLRAGYEQVAPHLLWVVAALVSMGLVDAIHGVVPFGVAWSWLRHGATLLGGILFGMVWLPVPEIVRRNHTRFVGLVATFAVASALAAWFAAAWLPVPFGATDYTVPVKAINAAGGVGFVASAAFFLRRYLRRPRAEELVFAAHALLFGAASLLFGFSSVWSVDWWAWHGLRLLAYGVVLVAAHRALLSLYTRVTTNERKLREANAALVAENAERRRAEAQLQEHRDGLERLVAQRTAALEAADQRKNDFLAMLSHELRNPLAPIRNSIFVLERSPAGAPQAKRAREIIDRQARHLTRLVEDLLDVTRISRGKVRLQKELLELDEIARAVGEDLRTSFAANGVEFVSEIAEQRLRIEGDRTRLAQVIGNLLLNAAKFTPSGGQVVLALRRDAGFAVLEVRDTGTGISADLLPILFEPFVQADRTLDRSRGGLGLGLALVKGLVEMHGGAVTARSEGPGKGSTFVLRLPLVAADESAADPVPEPRAAPDRLRVLVIEDNVDAAQSMKDALTLSGHQVAVAHSGPDGLEQARAFKPNAVVCDVGLPGLDGYGVAKALREEPELAAAFLVALTGYAQPEDVERAKAAGFDRHLAKPVDMAELEAMFGELGARLAQAS